MVPYRPPPRAPLARLRRRHGPLKALVLGLLHGAADALPVSSSGHVAAAVLLLRAPAPDPVGLHAGSLAAVVALNREEAAEVLHRLDGRRVALHLLAGGIPAAAGVLVERRVQARRRAGGGRWHAPADAGLVAGLLAGAALLALGDRRRGTRSRWDAGPADGGWLGLAQAAALWPGVSRNGATLAVARLRGFAPDEANRLSREIGVPVTVGAVALRRARPGLAAAASATGAVAALPLVRAVDRGGPLWPWALERAALALAVSRLRQAQLRSSAAA